MNTSHHWPRAIILLDMNAFFASIEQRDDPALRGRPVVITNGEMGSCVITCSYEARAFGVKTGMHLKRAQALCPHLIRVPSHPERYVETSRAIMRSLVDITPDIEVFSVDEAFLDVTHCQKLWGNPVKMAHMAKACAFEASGVTCSVGLSGDKTTAKYAAKLKKPDGFTVVPPWEAKARLRNVPVMELCGIAKGIGGFLARHGVTVCGDIEKLPISVLSRRFGNLGRRIWYMCQGQDPDPVHTTVAAPKSMGHGKVMPPRTTDEQVILTYLRHMSEKLAKRLRRYEMQAQHFFIGLRAHRIGWLGDKVMTPVPVDDGMVLFQLCQEVMAFCWHEGVPVDQVQVTALDPKPREQQLDFFEKIDSKQARLNCVTDQINARYGEFTIAPAALLKRSSMPNVIAPAWKPEGHRQTI